MNRLTSIRNLSLAPLAWSAVLALPFAACTGGSSPPGGTGGSFVVLKTEPLNNGRLYLNDPIRIDFSNPVDLGSADLTTMSFQVLDQTGNAVAEQPAGRFELAASPGDAAVGRRLLFIPRFPTNDTYDNGGFRPGRTYLVQLVGGDDHNGTVLRDVNGRGLAAPITFSLSTAEGSTPAQLFRDTVAGGPRKVSFTITPTPDATGANANLVVLNKFGTPPVELRLEFNQPLNPNSGNVPVALSTDPMLRSVNDRGRVYLEYDDLELGQFTWIPADVDLEVNDLSRSVLVLRPTGVLPNNANIRVIVLNTLEDISGESNIANAAYSSTFATFRTRVAYEPQFDAVIESFTSSAAIDFAAPFLEPQAEVGSGYLKAGFQFEGTPTALEYEPSVTEVILNTNFTQVQPSNGVPFNVSGGVFNFRRVRIPNGVRVFGQGTNPMVWLCSGDFIVDGLLSVRGGDGARVDTLNSANFPAAGGVGTCSGGNGGAGSPSGTQRDVAGGVGFGSNQLPGGGGRGGRLSCVASCGRGSGGGGGSLATQGDPYYKVVAGTGTSFQQQRGFGGNGCSGASGAASRTLAGGEPGPDAFADARLDNDFWGAAINVNRRLRIVGELPAPIGGQGGGGGGDLSNNNSCNVNDVNFASDPKGGGGGGGGGVLIVKALGNIVIGATGRIIADGGHGGGGEQAGSCNQGGGGGGGAGGMVILMAGRQIQIHAKGSGPAASMIYTYAQNNYDFSVSADGGVCLTGTFGTPTIAGKYPANGTAVTTTYGTNYDSAPLGAFGGMGIVQLMAPPGPTQTSDGTNTILDDNILLYRNGVLASGADKQGLIAWRGFPDAAGVFRDDAGTAINIGNNEGEIRPSPLLLPVPFSAKTRLRSRWLDTGASERRALTSSDGLPRGIVESGGFLAGPTYEFYGLIRSIAGPDHGYVDYEPIGEAVRINYPTVVSATPVQRTETIRYLDQDAYLFELAQPVLGAVVDRYSQYEAELLNAQGLMIGSVRILTHTDRNLTASAENGALPEGIASLRVRSKFFQIRTNGTEGLGPTETVGGTTTPIANVKIGFAFHADPSSATAERYPADPTQFEYDLGSASVQEAIRTRHLTYVQWDILFDIAFNKTRVGEPAIFGPSTARPELHFLRIPFRF